MPAMASCCDSFHPRRSVPNQRPLCEIRRPAAALHGTRGGRGGSRAPGVPTGGDQDDMLLVSLLPPVARSPSWSGWCPPPSWTTSGSRFPPNGRLPRHLHRLLAVDLGDLS